MPQSSEPLLRKLMLVIFMSIFCVVIEVFTECDVYCFNISASACMGCGSFTHLRRVW